MEFFTFLVKGGKNRDKHVYDTNNYWKYDGKSRKDFQQICMYNTVLQNAFRLLIIKNL